MKKILISLVVAVCLAIGGGVGYSYYFVYLQLPEVKEYRSRKGGAFFADVNPINVPVLRQGQVERYVIFHISLEFPLELHLSRANAHMTRLRDVYFTTLFEYVATVSLDATLNVTTIQQRILSVSEEVLGRGVVKKIHIQGVYQKQA